MQLLQPSVSLLIQCQAVEGGTSLQSAGSFQAVDTYVVQDDAVWFQRVSDVLAATDEKVAKESDLKVVLGLRLTKGHRMWRKIKVGGRQPWVFTFVSDTQLLPDGMDASAC
jgi:hypothetical protein